MEKLWKLIIQDDPRQLEAAVSEEIANGWFPLGGVSVVTHESAVGRYEDWVQPLIRTLDASARGSEENPRTMLSEPVTFEADLYFDSHSGPSGTECWIVLDGVVPPVRRIVDMLEKVPGRYIVTLEPSESES